MSAEDVDLNPTHQQTKIHCSGCGKLSLGIHDLANFVIVFWDKHDEKTGEPIVRDGIFTEGGQIAILKACLDCGPKIKKLHKAYTPHSGDGLLRILNDGPLKKMLAAILARRKAAWKLEIGWQIMLPILQRMKSDRMRKLRDIDISKGLERTH